MPLSKNKKDKLKKQAAGASISLAVVLCLLKGFLFWIIFYKGTHFFEYQPKKITFTEF